MQSTRRALKRWVLVAPALLLAGALAVGAPASPGQAGTPAKPSCTAVVAKPAAAAGATAPVTVTTVDGGRLVVASVCIGRSGPYPFVVDTGSPRSAIDARLASALHLAPRGAVALGGSGCATSGRLVVVPALRVGSIAVDGQDMVRTSLSGWSGRRFDGVLGSDVWGRFGAVRLDLTRQTLSVAAPEGPPSTSHAVVEGGSGANPPPSVALSTTAFSAPLVVVLAPGSIAAFVKASVAGHGPYAFAVDTGSPTSSLSATVGFTIGLSDQGVGGAPGGIGCTGSVHLLVPATLAFASSGPSSPSGSSEWTVALRATDVPGPLRSGMVGSVGLDVLGAHGALVVDYTDATLTTGSG